MSVRIAIVGAGKIARVHALAIQKLADAELTAVVNHRPESMAAFATEFLVPRRYLDLDDLLLDGGIDALIVDTPNYLHASQSIAALRAGIPVMVEKPMAINATEAARMVSASQQSGAPLMVAHCWRFDPEVRWLAEQVANGRLGAIVRTRGYGAKANRGPSGWYTQNRYAGGGAVADMGIHAIDTARFLMGDPLPVSVSALVGTYYRALDVDDTGVLLVRWENGAVSYIEAGWFQPWTDGPDAATQLYGTKGFGQLFPTRLAFPRTGQEGIDVVDAGFAERAQHVQQGMYDEEIRHFVQCLGKGLAPAPDGAQGLVNMRIVDAAYESARADREVLLGRA